MMVSGMRFKGATPPQTAAERQRNCRAKKRGTLQYCQEVPVDQRAPSPMLGRSGLSPALPAPAAGSPATEPRALPAPPVTAIQKATTTTAGTELGLPRAFSDVGSSPSASGEAIRLSLPPAVAARLKSLIDRHHAGTKPLTAAERAEAEGLLDIAEFFVVQRMRNRLAA
jgi:hypothetical protein